MTMLTTTHNAGDCDPTTCPVCDDEARHQEAADMNERDEAHDLAHNTAANLHAHAPVGLIELGEDLDGGMPWHDGTRVGLIEGRPAVVVDWVASDGPHAYAVTIDGEDYEF